LEAESGGTKVQVWFYSKVLNSVFMDVLQCLSFTAVEWQVGSISIAEDSASRALERGYRTLPSINSLGLDMLFLARVTMGCKDASGTEGGEGDAEISAGDGDSAEIEEAEERGCIGAECRDWEEWGEEDSMTGCGSCAADRGMRIGRENCCLGLQELDSSGDKVDVYGNVESVKMTSREI